MQYFVQHLGLFEMCFIHNLSSISDMSQKHDSYEPRLIQCLRHGDAIKMHNGIIFDFYTRLSQMHGTGGFSLKSPQYVLSEFHYG